MSAALRIAHPLSSGADIDSISVDYSGLPPTVPDEIYSAIFTHHETAFVFRTSKVFLYFRIIDPGEHFGKILYRAYRAGALKGEPRRNGGFKLRRGSDLLSMIFRILEISKARPDRVSLHEIKNCVLKIKTRTVTKDYQQHALPECMRYSVVADIIEKTTGT